MAGKMTFTASERSRRVSPISVVLLALVAATIHTQFVLSQELQSAPNSIDREIFMSRWFHGENRAVDYDNYQIVKYGTGDETSHEFISDCVIGTTNAYTSSFSALQADDFTEYFGHSIKSEDFPCMGDQIAQLTNTNIKECLEWADDYLDSNSAANAFMHDDSDGTCYVFGGWRRHKFRMCKRDPTDEKIFYLRVNEPTGYDPCTDLTVGISSVVYNAEGLVESTVEIGNNYCCCEVDRVTYEYLGITYTLSGPPFVYTYDLEDEGFMNSTTIRAYEGFREVAQAFNLIPDDLL